MRSYRLTLVNNPHPKQNKTNKCSPPNFCHNFCPKVDKILPKLLAWKKIGGGGGHRAPKCVKMSPRKDFQTIKSLTSSKLRYFSFIF